MDYERKGVTITWQIENGVCIEDLHSPVIFLDVMDGTNWRLWVRRMSKKIISLTIERGAEDNGPKEFGLHYEFFVNELQCSYSTRKRMHTFRFLKGDKGNIVEGRRLQMDSSDSTTIRCKLWRLWGSISKSSHFFVRTRLTKESYIFRGKVEKFSDFSHYEKKTLKTVTPFMDEREITVNLSLFPLSASNSDTIMEIELTPMSHQADNFFDFQIFILDSSGNKSDIGKFENQFRVRRNVKFVLPNVSKEYIMENAKHYLTNDALSLRCEFTFWSVIEYENVERTEFEADSVSEVKQTDFSKAVELSKARDGIPCDTKLQTATETFPAHTNILSAQSPVFEAMFKTNMKETIQKCVR
ncbi:hypothetical protein AVEN_149660-1, partial [Araneus ventricosus]